MSEPENFLTRWSRRKQETERAVEERPVDARDDVQGVAAKDITDEIWPETAAKNSELDAAAKAGPAETREPEFDVSTLPPIESIDIGTDIRPFLQKGVPLHLSREALRRAWTADPAIRDFIEVAENQWDFATGSDIPGFGPLEASDDVGQLLAEVFDGRRAIPVEDLVTAVSDPSLPVGAQDTAESEGLELTVPPPEPEELGPQALLSEEPTSESSNIVRCKEEHVALQHNNQNSQAELPVRRPHGRALPQ